MRRLALHSLPVLVLAMACMQTPPEPGGDPNCENRIGGSSVGCGNPTKGVAGGLMADPCLNGEPCAAGVEYPRYRLHLGEQLTLEWLPPARPGLNTELYREKRIEVRFGNQMPWIDSSTLITFVTQDSLSTKISFEQVCKAIDQPDKVCSLKRWTSVPITLKITAGIQAKGFEIYADLNGVWLMTESKTFEAEFMTGDSGLPFLEANTGIHSELSWPRPIQPEEIRLAYIPGSLHTQILCGDAPLNISPLTKGLHPVRAIAFLPKTTHQWVSVFAAYPQTSSQGDEMKAQSVLKAVDSLFLPPGFGLGLASVPCK